MMADMDAVYRQYGGMVTAYLIRLCGNEELAKDLTQETFYEAVKGIGRFDGKCNVYTWLCSIAKHLYIDSIRRAKPTEPISEQASAPGDFVDMLIQHDQAMAAHRLLHLLDEPFREVFTLRTFCNLTHAQIAELFGKRESWSRVTYYRARQMLQDAIMKENNE